ncbi:MAG: tripartite tricarboxylate transporter permease [Bacillota bacterium]
MEVWLGALGSFFSHHLYLYAIVGVYVGLIIGAIPGLGPVFALALCIPITFGLEPLAAMIALTAVYCGTVGGGSVSSILLNIPGTTGSISTCYDGYPLAQQGRAATALSVSFTSSIVGGLVGPLSLAFLGPLFGRWATKLGPIEFFSLVLLAFALVAAASKGDTLKGMLMAALGLLFSFVGMDVITGTSRFSFGNLYLMDGIPFSPAVIGLFAFPELIAIALRGKSVVVNSDKVGHQKGEVWEGVKAVLKAPFTIIRSSILGVFIGVMPGVGINVSNLVNYMVEKKLSKEPETFGKGNIKGLIAPEVANSATATGSLSTAFALGIPGGSSDAILLGGLMIFGLTPGKAFFDTSISLFFPTLIWGMLFAPLAMIGALFLVRYIAKVANIKHTVLVPMIALLSIVGAFANRGQVFDIWVMIFFGVLGYFLVKAKYPLANLVVAMVLGKMLEAELNRALRISGGSYTAFLESNISLVALVISAAILLSAFIDFKKLGRRLICSKQ